MIVCVSVRVWASVVGICARACVKSEDSRFVNMLLCNNSTQSGI